MTVRLTSADVERADEAADAAGLLLADAILDLDQATIDALPTKVRLLVKMAADTKADAEYLWRVLESASAQAGGDGTSARTP